MLRSPFVRNFSGSSEKDIVRGLEAHFRNRRKGGSAELPSLDGRDWRSWNPLIIHAYAEALLWAAALGDAASCPPPEFAELSPFGEGTPPLRELLSCPCSISQFPTVRRDAEATVWRLYLFRKPTGVCWHDHRDRLVNADGLSDEFGVFLMNRFQPPSVKLDGDSWQLAFHMAERLLAESGYGTVEKRPSAEHDCGFQGKLLQYLITGAVRNEQISAVKMEGKTGLSSGFEGFLIPEGNKDDVPDPENRKYHFVSGTDAAWRLVTGVGFNSKEISLPPEIDSLHILVGSAPQPVSSAILLLNPKRVTFWVSKETAPIAEKIRGVLSTRSGELPMTFECMPMDSHNLQLAYTELDTVIKQENCENQIISCTGGNRLMGFAALLVAQTHRLQVVYRDIDSPRNRLIGIQFEEDQRYSADIAINRCPITEKINWELLYRKTKVSVEELVSQLFID